MRNRKWNRAFIWITRVCCFVNYPGFSGSVPTRVPSLIWPFWPLKAENPVFGGFWWKITSTHKSWTDFYPKPHSRKKNLAQNSKAKAMWPPITKKAGLQDRPFLVFSYHLDLKVLKITLVFYCCGSLVIYILPVFSTVPWKKSLFENFMLWSRSCRISN